MNDNFFFCRVNWSVSFVVKCIYGSMFVFMHGHLVYALVVSGLFVNTGSTGVP